VLSPAVLVRAPARIAAGAERGCAATQVFADREAEEAGDAMAALENRTADSQVEMDILDALDDSKLLNARHQKARLSPARPGALHHGVPRLAPGPVRTGC
jgi:hypothetical protein